MSAIGASTGASAAVAAAVAVANAIKASGAIVRVEPDAFLSILERNESPLVVASSGRAFFTVSHQYMTSHRGFIFYTKSAAPLTIPEWCEVVAAKSIWTPT